MKKVPFLFGTRPEAINLSQVLLHMCRRPPESGEISSSAANEVPALQTPEKERISEHDSQY
jgi:hypothetical protein